MIDLKPLTTALRSDYTYGPEDIGPGRGKDPDGATCATNLKSTVSAPTYLTFGAINISAVPYSSTAEASTQFVDRLDGARKNTNAQSIQLDGDWDEGTLVRGDHNSQSFAYALVRKDSYLVKVDVTIAVTGADPESLSMAAEPLRPIIVDLVTSLYDGVGSKLTG